MKQSCDKTVTERETNYTKKHIISMTMNIILPMASFLGTVLLIYIVIPFGS